MALKDAKQAADKIRALTGRRPGIDTFLEDFEPPRSERLPEFPVHCLPEAAADYCRQLAEGGIPMEFLGPTALTALAAAVGGKAALVIKEGAWLERPILWTALIGRRGTKKSPALANLRRPFDELSDLRSRQFKQDFEAWDALPKKDQAITPKPCHKRLRVDDTTLEALGRTLEHNPAGVFLVADEAASLIQGLGQYKRGNGSDRARFLSLWNASPLVVDRVRDQHPLIVDHPIVCIATSTQPERLDVFGGNDGMQERWLISRYDGEPEILDDATPAGVARDVYRNLIRQLVSQRERERWLTLSPEAFELFRQYQLRFRDLQIDPDTADHVEGWLSKAPSHLTRIALVLALIEESEAVEPDHLHRAAVLVGYFLKQVRLLPTGSEDLTLPRFQRDIDRGIDALERAVRRAKDKRVTARQVMRSHIGGVRTAEGLRILLERYRDIYPGCIRTEEQPGNRPTLAVYAPGYAPKEVS